MNKVTDKFKRPFKKRHSSVYHQPQNRVNKYLSQAIEARSVDREKSEHVSLISLAFKDSSKESQVVLMLLLAVRLRWIMWDISQSFILRLAITVFTIILIYTVAQVNVFTCRVETGCPRLNSTVTWSDHRLCPLPQYIAASCCLGYLSVAIFLRLPTLVKCTLLALMALVYVLLIEVSHKPIFNCYDTRVQSSVPTHVISIVYILMFLLAVAIHGRHVEWTARLDFLWQIQVKSTVI
uniref:DUF1053 domain-containing protein n=1 Tax=Rhodnius prolixus TaxID=13249 RepID=T1I0P3_RHOPR